MAENLLTSVRDKFLRKAGYKIDALNPKYDEDVINARILTPLCAIDIAYAAFQTLPKDYFRQEAKKHFNDASAKFRAIFNAKSGILYSGLTEDEIMVVNDYMEKITNESEHSIDILKWQIRGRLMEFSTDVREIYSTLVFVMTICCYSHDMLEHDIKTDFRELNYIANKLSMVFRVMSKQIFGKNEPVFDFTDKQFEKTLTALFMRLNGITTEGIE